MAEHITLLRLKSEAFTFFDFKITETQDTFPICKYNTV
jgi:hypothetical protein